MEIDGDKAASEAYCTLALEGIGENPTLKINRVRYNGSLGMQKRRLDNYKACHISGHHLLYWRKS